MQAQVRRRQIEDIDLAVDRLDLSPEARAPAIAPHPAARAAASPSSIARRRSIHSGAKPSLHRL